MSRTKEIWFNNGDAHIISFGSCLSRFTSNHYVHLFGGKVISCVMHNRTDLFINNFFEHEDNAIDKSLLSDLMDEANKQIIDNQYRKTIGLHNLKRGLPFFDAIEEKADLIIFDNYIDIVSKCVILEDSMKDKSHKIFITVNEKKGLKGKLDELLPIEESIANFRKIISWARAKQPKATIVFLAFPGDMYPENNPRKNRFLEFARKFSSDDVDIMISPRLYSEIYATNQKQHYKAPFYSGIASMIYLEMNASNTIGKRF